MRAGVALAALAVLGLAAPVRGGQDRPAERREGKTVPGASAEATFWSILCPRAGAGVVHENRIAKELAKLGPDLIRPAVGLFLGDVEEPDLGYEADSRARDARPRILIAALKLAPKADVLRELEAASCGRKDVDRSLGIVRLLSEIGGSEALDRVMTIAAGLEPIQWERTFVQVPLQKGIARIVQDDVALAKSASRRIREAKPGLAAIFVRGLGEAGASSIASDLAYAFGRDARLDLCLAETLGSFGDAAAGMLPESALAALRSQVDAPDARIACAAATALGRLGDEAAANKLLRLLGDPDVLLKNAVLAALRSLAGCELTSNREDWKLWLDHEETWKADRLPDLDRAIGEADPAVLPGVLSEMVTHRLFRHRIAMDISPLLASPNPEIVRLACGVLPTLSSRTVVSALRDLLLGHDETITSAARAALFALTGSESGAPPGS